MWALACPMTYKADKICSAMVGQSFTLGSLLYWLPFIGGFDAVVSGRYGGGSLLCDVSPAGHYAARRALSAPIVRTVHG